jgi:hypothetical protein
MSNLTTENIELGARSARIGIGMSGDDQEVEDMALAGAEIAAEDGIDVFDQDQVWDVVGEIPPDTAAALLLIEHHWAVPLRDAIARAGGFRVSDGFINPLNLVEIGLMTAQEAEADGPDQLRQDQPRDISSRRTERHRVALPRRSNARRMNRSPATPWLALPLASHPHDLPR